MPVRAKNYEGFHGIATTELTPYTVRNKEWETRGRGSTMMRAL